MRGAYGTLSSEISHRLRLTVDVPEDLDDWSIAETVNVAASRLRWALSQRYQEQVRERET
jgi:hypothetical protein